MMHLIKTLVLSLFLGSFLLAPAVVQAVDVITPICDGKNNIESSQFCKDNLTNSNSNPLFGPEGILTTAISIISIVVAIVAIIVIIIAGIRFMTSQGNPQTINTARNQIIYAFIGIVTAAVAQGIVLFVLKKL